MISATYRIQFRKEFPFSAGAGLAGYLRQLGVSHVYSSPILTARAGSAHGYDVVRYDEINPELGGAQGFRAMAETLRAQGIGIILDIVPNHMAVGGGDNPMWLDCLKYGGGSRFAGWFDIDFDAAHDPELAGKIHAPFLGEPLPAVLAAGALRLARAPDGIGYAVLYGEHVFPVRPQDDADIAVRGLAAFEDSEHLAALLDRQHYVLDWWRNAGDRINWRRFFDITQLAAMRMEVSEAFDAAHGVPLALYADGIIDGLRIDHIDGLADPAGYCRRLRGELDRRQGGRPAGTAQGRAWLLVEKILARGEAIPADWDVDGSTGYDFMDEVSALQHDGSAQQDLARHWSAVSGRTGFFHDEEREARRAILDMAFDGQRDRLVDAIADAAGVEMWKQGVTRHALRRACTEVLAAMRAYRGYATANGGTGPQITAALDEAGGRVTVERHALNLIQRVFNGGYADETATALALRRFNQLSAPLAAKAVEDTAFYRYGRLLSRNDVGFDAGHLALEPQAFHALMMERAQHLPRAMLTTATHDHKRGEDVRARLAVLSEVPDRWIAASERWLHVYAEARPGAPSPADIHMLHQMIVGAWPLDLSHRDADGLAAFAARLSAWWIKAMREAKLSSSWSQPADDAENNAARFVAETLDPAISGAFLAEAGAFVERIARPAAANGLVQKALSCLLPGVPDIYQGSEFWDFSLVDPDNRRPVDFVARYVAMQAPEPIEALLPQWRDGRIKQALLQRILALRQSLPDVFSGGDYVPIEVTGRRRGHVLAFLRRRGDQAVFVAAALRVAEGIGEGAGLAPEAGWWGDTALHVPEEGQDLAPVIAGSGRSPATIDVGDCLGGVPLAVWASEGA